MSEWVVDTRKRDEHAKALCDEIAYRCQRIAESKRNGGRAKSRLVDALAATRAADELQRLYAKPKPKAPKFDPARAAREKRVREIRDRQTRQSIDQWIEELRTRENERTTMRMIRIAPPMTDARGEFHSGLVQVRVKRPPKPRPVRMIDGHPSIWAGRGYGT